LSCGSTSANTVLMPSCKNAFFQRFQTSFAPIQLCDKKSPSLLTHKVQVSILKIINQTKVVGIVAD
jgi:hypothetical protein